MGKSNIKLYNLAELEGKISPHQGQVKGGLKIRAAALEFVGDVEALAQYLGGSVEELGIGEDWAVSKEFFPGAFVHFIFNKADDEFPAILRALYSGARIKTIHGDELANLTIFLSNQLVRYVRETNPDKKLPEVCYKV